VDLTVYLAWYERVCALCQCIVLCVYKQLLAGLHSADGGHDDSTHAVGKMFPTRTSHATMHDD
jgi:hypothetical protein